VLGAEDVVLIGQTNLDHRICCEIATLLEESLRVPAHWQIAIYTYTLPHNLLLNFCLHFNQLFRVFLQVPCRDYLKLLIQLLFNFNSHKHSRGL